MTREAILIIDRNDSRCSACGKGASPHENRHRTRLGYGDHDGMGCGALFTSVGSNYTGMYRHVQPMRPDIPWLDLFGRNAR